MSEKYEDFFKKAKEIQKSIERKKLRGLNDFNIFTTLLKADDEAKVHSRFIHSLLDKEGEHYQKELFLELFIKECGLEDFGLNIKSAIAYTEYEYIDIYLTDGKKHIIIENKINAPDQEHQIKRYIENIVNEYEEIQGKDICVIYLTLDRKKPSKNSLENFALKNDYLEYQNDGKLAEIGKIKYKSIHYNEGIMNWLNASLYEVSNLTNLHVIITQYKNTIKLLYGKYRGVEMELDKFLEENYEVAKEMYENFERVKKEIVNNFLKQIVELFNEKSNTYKVCPYPKSTKSSQNKIRINKPEWNEMDKFLCFIFDFNNTTKSEEPYFGIEICNFSSEKIKEIKEIKEKNKIKWEQSKYYINGDELCYFWLSEKIKIEDDFVLNLINKSNEEKNKLANEMVKIFIDFISELNPIVEKINEDIKENI